MTDLSSDLSPRLPVRFTSQEQTMTDQEQGTVFDEIQAERDRQDAKWGEQNHPDVDPVLMGRTGGCTPQRMAEEYEIPSPRRAQFLCDNRFRNGGGTWAHILVEEVAEAIESATVGPELALRDELIQVAAVAAAWVEAIDRRGGVSR